MAYHLDKEIVEHFDEQLEGRDSTTENQILYKEQLWILCMHCEN